MKVFIITEGGRHVGFGHVTRCISLYQAFEEKSIIPKFIVNGDNNVEGLLKDKNYEIFNWFDEKNKVFELIKNADIVIIDSYLADISFYENLSNLVKIPVYIGDNKRLNYPKGIVVNGSIYAEELDYPKKNGVVYLLGSEYIPLRREFWKVPEKEIKEKIESIMITFGGGDVSNMTPKILRFLTKSYPNFKKNVIIGKAFQNIYEIKREADKNTNLIYCPDVGKMREIMLASDIAISTGGQTLYELARVGTPMIVIAVAENQLSYINAMKDIRSIKYAGWWEDKEILTSIRNVISEFENRKERENIKKVVKRVADGQGSKRIVNFLISLWKKKNERR